MHEHKIREHRYLRMWKYLCLLLQFAAFSTEQDCKDADKYAGKCTNWKRLCNEKSYKSFMESNCAKTCQFCSDRILCEDDPGYAANCESYKSRKYCKDTNPYVSQMKKFCPKTCGFCSQCEDNKNFASRCSTYKTRNFCKETSSYYERMQSLCAKTCGFCGDASKELNDCKDDSKYKDNCQSFKANGFCNPGQDYYNSMKQFCPKTCGLCDKLSSEECAKGPSLKGRVVGGQEAQPNSWPWQVGLLYKGKFDCGGTLIGKQWIMTAGHCVVDRNIGDMRAVLGEHDWSKISGAEQTYKISRAFKYPGYNLRDNFNDLALLKLNSPVKITKEVKVACLPKKSDESENGRCFITGWGYTSSSSSNTSKTLQEVELPVADRDDCQNLNFRIGTGLKLGRGQMCAGYGADYSKVQTGCRGDSGGPLSCQYGIHWSVDGIVSSGSSKCLGFEKYTIFTKVSYYRDWIDRMMSRF